MSHVVEIIHYVAWPLVVLVIFFLIRNPFKLLISSIEELVIRYKDFQASAKVKPKDVKNLPAPKVQTEAIAPEPPPDYKEDARPIILLKDARKVLATLFDGQLRHFGEEDISKGQWSFQVLPRSPEYGNFMLGFAQLLELGLAGWEQKNGQAVLTKKGWEYSKEHPKIRYSEDVYRF
ncbi:MAG TPA: hypothetical protein DIU00_14100 [Phycisphaerales bacterium]|nr:hypothetical protein [Phycisphaerales bacterium]